MSSPATFTMQLQWRDPDGTLNSPKPRTVQCPYNVVVTGSIPVPPGTPSGTEFDLPLPGISCDATLVVLDNKTDVEFTCAWGGNWAPTLPPDGMIVLPNPAPRSSNYVGPSATYRFMTRAPVVNGGQIIYRVFGS